MPDFSLTQPCCDLCFVRENPGRVAGRLREQFRGWEVCAHCGNSTKAGIYVRVDPEAPILYPTLVRR